MNTYALQFSSASQQWAGDQNQNRSVLVQGGSFTIEAWISSYIQDNNQWNGSSVICSVWDDASQQNFSFLIDASHHPRLRIATARNADLQAAADAITLDAACRHIALVFSPGQVQAYSNGVLVQTITTSTDGKALPAAPYVPSPIPQFRIGAMGTSSSGIQQLANQTIDDVRLWNVARTADQILQNYQREITEPEANLVGYWKLNNSYLDSSGNGNHLSPSGLPVFVTNVCFADSTTTSTSTTTTSTSTSTTTTSTSTTTTTSTSTSTSSSTSTTTTLTSTSTTRTTTSTSTTTSTTTTLTSTSTTTSTSLTTSTTITVGLNFMVEKVR